MDKSKTFLSRRRILKGAGVATGIGIIGGGSLLYSSQPALAAVGDSPISASGLDMTANDGSVSEVTVTPALSLQWSKFSSGISGFDIELAVAPAGGTLTTAKSLTGISDGTTTDVSSYAIQNSGSNADPSGIADISLAGTGLVSSGALTQSDLPSNVGDGDTVTETIDFAVTVTANSASGGGSATDTSPSPSGSFDVTLTNDAGSTTATGTVATDGTTE
jgi:hypothetical protein